MGMRGEVVSYSSNWYNVSYGCYVIQLITSFMDNSLQSPVNRQEFIARKFKLQKTSCLFRNILFESSTHTTCSHAFFTFPSHSQKTKYTYAKIYKNDDTKTNQGGIGWSSAGMEEYNNIWKWVRVDRLQRGEQFNIAFLEYYENTHIQKRNANKGKTEDKVNPIDGLNPPSLADLFPGQDLSTIQEV